MQGGAADFRKAILKVRPRRYKYRRTLLINMILNHDSKVVQASGLSGCWDAGFGTGTRPSVLTPSGLVEA